MKIYFAGSVQELKEIKDPKDTLLFLNNRLHSFFFKNEAIKIIEIKKEITNENQQK